MDDAFLTRGAMPQGGNLSLRIGRLCAGDSRAERLGRGLASVVLGHSSVLLRPKDAIAAISTVSGERGGICIILYYIELAWAVLVRSAHAIRCGGLPSFLLGRAFRGGRGAG